MTDDQLSRFRGSLPGALIAIKSGPELREIRTAIREFIELLPVSVIDLKTEADLRVVIPWFMRSLSVPGDLCEFGCYKGTMSIKFAFALAALGRTDKTVYAFDTFEGFEFDDPSGGPIRAGAYGDNDDAFGELSRWSKVLPLEPMKGDARELARRLNKPLSFVWFDMDYDMLMAPVLETIWPLIGPGTVVGIDDVGRPETPSVQPWVERIVGEGRLVELERIDGTWMRFFRPNKS